MRHAYVAYLNEAPTVSTISPSTATNNGIVHVTLSGLSFRAGATVRLKTSGQTNIGAFNVNVNGLASLTCSFNLNGKPPGQWNVEVTNTDGQSGTLTNGFLIAQTPSPSPCTGYLLSPVYQVTNLVLRLTNTSANEVYDLFTVSNLISTNWTWLMRGSNGQTEFIVTNPPRFESYYTSRCTN